MDYNALNKDEQREGFIFHILSDFVSENSRDKLDKLAKELSQIYPCEIHIHICEDKMVKELPSFCTALTFFRLFIPDILAHRAKSCLYLDVDMLVLGDLRGLFALDLTDKIAAVIKDIADTRKWVNANSAYSFDFYFNAGFLLLNLGEFIKQNVQKQCFDFLFRYKPYFADQDALNNAISRDKAIVLPVEFNLFPQAYDEKCKLEFEYSKEQVRFACANPIILHYAGNAKAWNLAFDYMDTNLAFCVGLRWWQIAFQTPYFNDEFSSIFFDKWQEMLLIYNECKDEYYFRKDFGKYIGFLILQNSQNLLGYLKMPFVVYRAFKDKERGRLDLQNLISQIPNFTPNEHNLVYALYGAAQRAWDNKHKGRLLDLPHRAWRLKLRYEKYGIARAMTQEN